MRKTSPFPMHLSPVTPAGQSQAVMVENGTQEIPVPQDIVMQAQRALEAAQTEAVDLEAATAQEAATGRRMEAITRPCEFEGER